MAPAVRGSRVSKRSASLGLKQFAKVSKNATVPSELLEKKTPAPAVNEVKRSNLKRKQRSGADDDTESDQGATVEAAPLKKQKTLIQLPSPPPSRRGREPEDSSTADYSPEPDFRQLSLSANGSDSVPSDVPRSLQDFKLLYKAFLRAFALHLAHNHCGVPAELNSLLSTVTRLWKRHHVTKEDLQRLLAVYEIHENKQYGHSAILEHKTAPFKLVMTGIGDTQRHSVEFVGDDVASVDVPFNETSMAADYAQALNLVWLSRHRQADSFVHGVPALFPRLRFSVGAQTLARKEKAAAARKEILGLSSDAQRRSGAASSSPTPAAKTPDRGPEELKARTLSLFDRVRAKQMANVPAPSAQAVLRQHAIGRITEVVEILRMKQQQKSSASLDADISCNRGSAHSRATFSLNQLVAEIRQSVGVPMGDSEIKMCLDMLVEELPGRWVSKFSMGQVSSIILNGTGVSGVEARKILDQSKKMSA